MSELLPQENRRILHIDMNAFFASVEQQANPYLRGKPVAVTGGREKHKGDYSTTKGYYPGAAILAASYPAKKLGIGLGTRLGEALSICPELIPVPMDTNKYYSVNRQIVQIFREECPNVELYSIDEAFLDVTGITKTLDDAYEIAKRISTRILKEVGCCMTTSIGVSHNKLLAKIGSNYKKPDAITKIPWEDRFKYLDSFELGKIWGIGFHSTPKLKALGVSSTADIRKIDSKTLSGLVGSYYTRLEMIANGENYESVNERRSTKAQKSMQHAHTLSEATNDTKELSTLIRKQSERLARRLRKHNQKAQIVSLGLRPAKQIHYGWGYTPNLYDTAKLRFPTNTGREIYYAAMRILHKIHINDEIIRLVVVGLDQLTSTDQLELTTFRDIANEKIDSVTDQINDAFGEFKIRTGDILYQYAKEKRYTVEKENLTFHPE